jgi:hypothetical protein
MSAQHASNVRVLVRVRPLSEREKRSGDTPCLTVRPHDVVVLPADQSTASSYTCDLCYAPQATQQMLFDTSGVKDLARAAFDGYRTCLFAYGQVAHTKVCRIVSCLLTMRTDRSRKDVHCNRRRAHKDASCGGRRHHLASLCVPV